jgi:predicted nucleic acid-binding protein
MPIKGCMIMFETYQLLIHRAIWVKMILWIASLAALMGLTLITTDADFDHLNDVFFEVRKINPKDFVRFF